MLEKHLRQTATVLLESTIRIAPPEARDWGRGMLGELTYVDRPWSAVWWAVGGASVLAQQALVSLIIPDRRGRAVMPEGGLFARAFPLREISLAACGVFVLGALLFFLGPPFRQGVRISLAAWHEVLLVATSRAQPAEDQARTEPLGARVFGREVAARNALVLHVATLALLFFSALMVLAAAVLLRGIFKRAQGVSPGSHSVALAMLLTGAPGFLISSATIYLTYRPYWYIYQNQVLKGNLSRADAARDFLTVAQSLRFYGLAAETLPLYFWIGVILLGASGLVLILLRHFRGRPRVNPSA